MGTVWFATEIEKITISSKLYTDRELQIDSWLASHTVGMVYTVFIN